MPEKITLGGRDISFRGLTRREVKRLKADGFNLNNLYPEQLDDAVDAVFSLVMDQEDIDYLDDCVAQDALKAWRAVMDATFGSKAAEKNSSAPGNGAPTKSA
jgi:hypothetical protein